jgi:hypothetical protein
MSEDDVWSMRMRKRALRRKRRWKATLALAVFVVLGLMVWLAMIGSMWLAVLFAALFIGSALLLVYYLRRAVMCGELPQRFPFGTIFRHKSPISFWFGLGVHGLFAAFLFFVGLRIVGLAPHWFIALMKK